MTKKIKADQIVEGVKLGLKNTDIADALQVHRNTVSYHLNKLRAKLQDKSPTEYAAFVRQQVELMTALVEEVHQGKLPSDAANSIRGLMDSIARLTGSNAPSRRMSLNLNGHVDGSTPVQDMTDDELHMIIGRAICEGHSEEQVRAIWNYATAMVWNPPLEVVRLELERNDRFEQDYFQPEPDGQGEAEIILDDEVKEDEKLQ